MGHFPDGSMGRQPHPTGISGSCRCAILAAAHDPEQGAGRPSTVTVAANTVPARQDIKGGGHLELHKLMLGRSSLVVSVGNDETRSRNFEFTSITESTVARGNRIPVLMPGVHFKFILEVLQCLPGTLDRPVVEPIGDEHDELPL